MKSAEYKKEKARIRNRRWMDKNPERLKELRRIHYEKHKVKIKAWHRDYKLRITYGITPKEWEELFLSQNSCCAICGNQDSNQWHTDHCHTTGKIRGILCRTCNPGLGLFKEDADILLKAAEYIKNANT